MQDEIKDKGQDAFIRWQGITLQQLSFVNNLVLGLCTGILALQFNVALNNGNAYDTFSKHLLFSSAILIFISLAVGVFTAWNRLTDFRTTMRIAHKRWKGKREGIEELREKAEFLGKRTWCLLGLQLVTFGVGVLLMLSFVVVAVFT